MSADEDSYTLRGGWFMEVSLAELLEAIATTRYGDASRAKRKRKRAQEDRADRLRVELPRMLRADGPPYGRARSERHQPWAPRPGSNCSRGGRRSRWQSGRLHDSLPRPAARGRWTRGSTPGSPCRCRSRAPRRAAPSPRRAARRRTPWRTTRSPCNPPHRPAPGCTRSWPCSRRPARCTG